MHKRKTFHRTDRVSAQLRRDLGELVHEITREHALPMVSVSDVEVTRDLAYAKVFITALQSERSKEAITALNGLAWEIRQALSKKIQLRHVPELQFHYDNSVDQGEQMEALLKKARAQDEQDSDS